MMGDRGRAVVARIGKPHGIHGEVTVQAHTDDPATRFAAGAVFATDAPVGAAVPARLTVVAARPHTNAWLLTFDEVVDRTGAETLRGTLLLAEQDSDGDENVWYERDLAGLTAYDRAGARLGVVTGLDTGTAQDRLRVRLLDGHVALVPFVEALVPEVDVDGGRVVIDAPPGLLDLGREG